MKFFFEKEVSEKWVPIKRITNPQNKPCGFPLGYAALLAKKSTRTKVAPSRWICNLRRGGFAIHLVFHPGFAIRNNQMKFFFGKRSFRGVVPIKRITNPRNKPCGFEIHTDEAI